MTRRVILKRVKRERDRQTDRQTHTQTKTENMRGGSEKE